MVKYTKKKQDIQMDFWVLQGLMALLGFAVALVYVIYRHLKRR